MKKHFLCDKFLELTNTHHTFYVLQNEFYFEFDDYGVLAETVEVSSVYEINVHCSIFVWILNGKHTTMLGSFVDTHWFALCICSSGSSALWLVLALY